MSKLKYNADGHKRCYKCKCYRTKNNFGKNALSSDGKEYACFDCKKQNPLLSKEDKEKRRLESFKATQLEKFKAEPLVYEPIEKRVNIAKELLTWDKLKTCRLVNKWVYPDKPAYELWLENKRKNILHNSFGY